MLLDSNILIYAAEPAGAFLSRWVEDEAARITKLTRSEALGFPRWHLVDETRRTKLETLVGTLLELQLDDRVAERAIELRRQKKMAVMDAVSAGAALTNRLPLVTRNGEDFAHIDGLQIINPFQQQNQE